MRVIVNRLIHCYLEPVRLVHPNALLAPSLDVRTGLRSVIARNDKLAKFLSGLPPRDQAHWESLTPARRREAAARFVLFDQWEAGELSAEEAINQFGKSPSRFYRLAAQWRDRPSLDALGVGIRAPRTRARLDPVVVNALQAKVSHVVRMHADASVSQQAAFLLEAAGFGGQKPIGTTALRKIVETERRRVEASGRLGHQIGMDCSAINLPQASGRPYILYVIVDAGTGITLGFALSASVDVTAGYSAAAGSAAQWIEQNGAGLPWSSRLSQTILVSGDDDAKSKKLVEGLSAAGIGGNVLRSSGRKRFGSQFRKAYGERLGRIQITPARTLEGDALPDNGNMTAWSADEAHAELERTFQQSNAALLGGLSLQEGSLPPSSLIHFLNHVSSWGKEHGARG